MSTRAILLVHMQKKIEINWTKIKVGCQSERKVVTHNSKSDLVLVNLVIVVSLANKVTSGWMKLDSGILQRPPRPEVSVGTTTMDQTNRSSSSTSETSTTSKKASMSAGGIVINSTTEPEMTSMASVPLPSPSPAVPSEPT